MAGLEPREFIWVINGVLATSERIGGYGFQHRRVRRAEEIAWLAEAGITAVLSLLDGNHNLGAYEEAGLDTYHQTLGTDAGLDDAKEVFMVMSDALAKEGTVLLVHRDTVDDTVAGVLAGYLVFADLLSDPIVATSVIQEILGRPLGPVGRALIP
ncbi:MAG: hypothetical protein V3R84_06475 [Acidimicrobiia bacterium]